MDYVLSLLGPLAQGAAVTLKLFAITLVLAVPLGLVLALARVKRVAPLSTAVHGFIWLMPGTPRMLQLVLM
jgi:polar amino acid transport system permease protein